jgi:lipopolysaccharide export system protein LptC
MAPDNSSYAEPRPPPGSETRKRQMAGWRKRSQTIRFWRRALPVLIALIAGMLVLWVGGRSVIIKLTAPHGPRNTGVHMVNPRFYGRDTSNRAFVLGAREAARDMTTGKSVTLSSPNVTLDADGSSPTHVRANTGVYREDQRKLSLAGKVELHSAGGYNFTASRAIVDTTNGTVLGDSGVQGQGPLGHIAASSYGVYDRGQRIIMKGDVRARIVQ